GAAWWAWTCTGANAGPPPRVPTPLGARAARPAQSSQRHPPRGLVAEGGRSRATGAGLPFRAGRGGRLRIRPRRLAPPLTLGVHLGLHPAAHRVLLILGLPDRLAGHPLAPDQVFGGRG